MDGEKQNPMEEKINSAIEALIDQTKAHKHDSQKALHCSQAVLNLTHAKQLLVKDK